MTDRRMRGALALAAAGVVLGPGIASAQTIRGVVVDSSGAPVPGVVVSMVDAATSVAAARALTNERGEYRVATPRAGSYRLETLRIGFRPAGAESIALSSGQEVTRRIVLTGVPFSLAAVRVEGRSSCRALGDVATATFGVWEQARAALTATQLTASARTITARAVRFDRTLDPAGRRVLADSAGVWSAVVTQPWSSLSPDAVRRAGYVATDPDGWTTYSAPGLDVLLSQAFLEDHCFRLTAGPDRRRVGIAFEPTPERRARRAVAEIRGTLWLDRASSELRALEFGYVNLSPEQQESAGGAMEFARMRDGAWAVSKWHIRMPRLERLFRARNFGGDEIHVAELKVTGGELVLARRGADTVWAGTPRTVTGTVLDSTSGAPVAGARVRLGDADAGPLDAAPLAGVTDARGRFLIPDVLPGEYTLQVRTASLDSVSVVHQVPLTVIDAASPVELRVPTGEQIAAALCGRARAGAAGIVVGTVAMRDGSALPGEVRVVAEWMEDSTRTRSDSGTTVPLTPPDRAARWLETRADARGTFRLCGVPTNIGVAMRAEADSVGAIPVSVRIASGRTARAELVLDRAISRAAVFAGLVLADTTARPIAGAEVVLPEIQKAVLTNEAGAFRVTDVPPGRHRVQVRRLGYGPLDTTVTFAANQTVDRRIYLRRVVTLDSVSVVAERVVIPSFEEHRKIGLGHFLTRDELAKQEGRKLSEILEQAPGAAVVQGHGNHAWVSTSRGPRNLRAAIDRDMYAIDAADSAMGAKPGCYSQVYVDRHLVYRSRPGAKEPLFDINSIAPSQIEAIEYYASPAQTPPEYGALNSPCGVIVIWTRKSP